MCRSMWDLCDCVYVGIWRRLNNWEIDHCNLIFSFDLIVYIIIFSLAYSCFSCCVWTAMIVIRIQADNHTDVGGLERLYGVLTIIL